MIPIAFVDDYQPIRSLIINLMNQHFPDIYQFYEYENGKVFTERFPTENYTPAIVLMDLSMPEMNGYDTTAWIKEKCPTIPVLIFSDINRPDSLCLFVRCGADGYICKQEVSEKNKLNFKLLSDPDRKTVKEYGAWGPKKFLGRDFFGISRNTYIINPDGMIVKEYLGVNPKTHAAQIIADLKKLQAA